MDRYLFLFLLRHAHEAQHICRDYISTMRGILHLYISCYRELPNKQLCEVNRLRLPFGYLNARKGDQAPIFQIRAPASESRPRGAPSLELWGLQFCSHGHLVLCLVPDKCGSCSEDIASTYPDLPITSVYLSKMPSGYENGFDMSDIQRLVIDFCACITAFTCRRLRFDYSNCRKPAFGASRSDSG